MPNLSVTAERTRACVLCARTSRDVMQWIGERSQEDKLDCYCVNGRVYIHSVLSTCEATMECSRVSDNDYELTRPVLIIAFLLC